MNNPQANMNRSFLNSTISLLVLVALCFSIAGCVRNNAEMNIRYIDESTPWYESVTTSCGADDIGSADCASPIYADPNIVVFFKNNDDVSTEPCGLISIVDHQGQITHIDLEDYFSDTEHSVLYSVFDKEDAYYAVVSYEDDGELRNSIYRLSLEDSSMEFCYEINPNEDHPGMYVDRVIYSNNKYYAHMCYLDGVYYRDAFLFLDNEGNELLTIDVDDMPVMWTVNDAGELLYVGWNQSNQYSYNADVYRINPDNGEITSLGIDEEILDRYRMGLLQSDGCIYCNNNDLTLTKLNVETGEETLVLDYNNSDVNLANIMESTLFYCDEDNIVAVKSVFYPLENDEWSVYSLHKSDNNPHVGKQIITAAPYCQINILAASAIRSFNESSEQAYIYVTMDYSRLTFTDYEDSGVAIVNDYNRDLAILSTLKNDIRYGVGPDIILDYGTFATLNNTNYLQDLSAVINDPDCFNRDDYFSNIIDAYTIDGSLFQIPVSACVAGIYSNKDWNGYPSCGFTFDEYDTFVQNHCNGLDPLGDNYGRDLSLDYLVRSNYDALHDDNGHITLDNETFRDICEYTQNQSTGQNPSLINSNAQYVSLVRVHYDLTRMLIDSDKELYGLPSLNGESGPVALCNESVAITSCTTCSDELIEFVRIILSYDVQIMNVNYNPINREAMQSVANDALNYANSYIESVYGINNYNDPEVVNEYINYLSSANTCYLADDNSLMVLNEELQPYYEGQKSIDEVIQIAEDRINNMIDEMQ